MSMESQVSHAGFQLSIVHQNCEYGVGTHTTRCSMRTSGNLDRIFCSPSKSSAKAKGMSQKQYAHNTSCKITSAYGKI